MLLVFGQTGQVARELAEIRPDALFLGRGDADLSDPDACARAIKMHKPTGIINAAAWTNVDGAEEEVDAAHVVNGAAPTAMAAAAADLNVPFVHISTDYVFDGTGTAAWSTKDQTDPVNFYGASKLAGEDGVRAAGGTYAILRTAWVFSAHGGNFVKSMLKLSETRDTLGVVADQIGGPTPAAAIARACVSMVESLTRNPSASGTYHFSGAPDVSWADFAREIFTQTGRDITVNNLTTAEFPRPAPRPSNSRLDCATTEAVFGIRRPDWKAELSLILERLDAK